MPKNPRFSVTLTEKTAGSLRLLCEQNDQSISEYIAMLVNSHVVAQALPAKPTPKPGEIMRTDNPRKRKKKAPAS